MSRGPSRQDVAEQRLLNDSNYQAQSARIRWLQSKLRTTCSDEAWGLYLLVEEASNARMGTVIDLLMPKETR